MPTLVFSAFGKWRHLAEPGSHQEAMKGGSPIVDPADNAPRDTAAAPRTGTVGPATHDLLRHLVEATPPRLPLPDTVADAAALRRWQADLREALVPVLGVRPESVVPTNVAVDESVPEDGYVRHHLRYAGAFGGTITAYLLVPELPDGARVTGVLCLHGHGDNLGKALVAGVPADAAGAAIIERHHYDFAARFAQHGFVTLAPDALGFGERAPDKGAGYHTAMGLVAEYLGLSLVGLRLLDDARSLGVLAARPEVDPDRLGAVGLSEGGKRALFLAAFDERVRVTVVSGYFTTLRDEVRAWKRLQGWDLCNHLSGLLRVCDLPDVAALVAPRALLIQNGRRDSLYGVPEVEAGFASVRRAYRAAGVPDACLLDLFDGEHVFMLPAAQRWLDRFLDG